MEIWAHSQIKPRCINNSFLLKTFLTHLINIPFSSIKRRSVPVSFLQFLLLPTPWNRPAFANHLFERALSTWAWFARAGLVSGRAQLQLLAQVLCSWCKTSICHCQPTCSTTEGFCPVLETIPHTAPSFTLVGLFRGTFPVLNQFSVSVLGTLGLFQPVFFSSSLQTVGHLVGINLGEEEARLPAGK